MHRSCIVILSALLACATAAAEDGDLTVPEARVLAQTQGDLRLGDVASLTPAVAAALAQHRGLVVSGTSANTLFLDGIREVSDEVADRLLQHEGPISMKGLTTLSHAGLTRKLSACNGLGTSTAIASEAAERALEVARAESLVAAGTPWVDWPEESVSLDAADVLATARGNLTLREVVRLDADVAAALAKHRRFVQAEPIGDQDPVSGGHGLEIGVVELEPEVAMALANYAGSFLFSRLKTISAETAAALARHRGPALALGLEELDPEAAEALSAYPGQIRLWNVKDITLAAVEKLAAHEGTLDLHVDVSQATILAALDRHQGPVWVNGSLFPKTDSNPVCMAGYEAGERQAAEWGEKRTKRVSEKFIREHAEKHFASQAMQLAGVQVRHGAQSRYIEYQLRYNRLLRDDECHSDPRKARLLRYVQDSLRDMEDSLSSDGGHSFNASNREHLDANRDALWELFWKGYQAAIQDFIDGKEPKTKAQGADGDAVPERFGLPPNSRPPVSIPRRRPPGDDR